MKKTVLLARLSMAAVSLAVLLPLASSAALHSLLNISTRAFVQTGDSVLIAGFIVGGNGAGEWDSGGASHRAFARGPRPEPVAGSGSGAV